MGGGHVAQGEGSRGATVSLALHGSVRIRTKLTVDRCLHRLVTASGSQETVPPSRRGLMWHPPMLAAGSWPPPPPSSAASGG